MPVADEIDAHNLPGFTAPDPTAMVIVKYDLAVGSTDTHVLGAGCQAGEAVFVAADG